MFKSEVKGEEIKSTPTRSIEIEVDASGRLLIPDKVFRQTTFREGDVYPLTNQRKFVGQISYRLGKMELIINDPGCVKINRNIKADDILINCRGDVELSKGINIQGKKLSLKANRLTNYASVAMTERLTVDVERLWNQNGTLTSEGMTKIEANKFSINWNGKLGGANTTLVSGMSFNFFLSDIFGSDNLEINTLFNFNLLSIYRSWNANVNSFINFNAGLIAPLINPSSWSAVFSIGKLWSLSRMMLSTAFPLYSSSVNFAYTAIPIASSVISMTLSSTWMLSKSIVRRDFSSITNSLYDMRENVFRARLKDYILVILKAKNLAVATHSLHTSSSHLQTEYSQNFNWDRLKDSLNYLDFRPLMSKSLHHIGSVFAPMYSSTTLFDFNLGWLFSGNIYEMNLMSWNMETLKYLNPINILTKGLNTLAAPEFQAGISSRLLTFNKFFNQWCPDYMSWDLLSRYISGYKIAGQSLVHTSKAIMNEGGYQSLFGSLTLSASNYVGSGSIRGGWGLSAIFDRMQLDKGAQINGENVHLKTDKLILEDKASAYFKNGHIHLKERLDVKKGSTLSIDQLQLNAKNISLEGKVNSLQSFLHAQDQINLKDGLKLVSDKTFIESDKSITIDNGASITGQELSLKTNTLTNYGSVKVKNFLKVDVEKLWNSSFGNRSLWDLLFGEKAKLESNGMTVIEANEYVVNLLGQIGGANTIITSTLSANLLGDIKGSDYLEINAFFALNLGLYRSWNVNVNSLINFNAGLIAPLVTPSSWSAIFSPQRFLSLSRTLFTSMFPAFGAGINFVYTTLPLASTIGTSVWNGINTLRNGEFSLSNSFESFRNSVSMMRVIDLIPTVLKVKNFAVAAHAANQAKESMQREMRESKSHNWSGIKDGIRNFSPVKTLKQSLMVFAPSYSGTSVINVNARTGAIVTGTAHEMDYKGYNFGAKVAQTWSHISTAIKSRGLWIGSLSVSAKTIHLDGVTLATSGSSLTAQDEMVIDGTFRGTQTSIKSSTLDFKGQVDLQKSSVQANSSLMVSKGGKLTAAETSLKTDGECQVIGNVSLLKSKFEAKLAIISGTLKTEKSQIHVKEKFETTGSSNTDLVESSIKARQISLDGETSTYASVLEADDKMVINGNFSSTQSKLQANSLEFKGKAQLDRSVVQADSSLVVSEGSDVSVKDSLLKTDGDLKVVGKVSALRSLFEAKSAVVKGQLTADKSQFKVKEKFETESTATIVLTQSEIKAQEIVLAGNTQLDSTLAEAKGKITLADDMTASKSKFDGQTIQLGDRIKLDKTLVKAATDITLQNGLSLTSDESLLEAGNEILVSGKVNVGGDSLSLKADLLTNYGSISTKKALSVDVERLWNQFGVLKSDGLTHIEANKYFFNLFGHVGGTRTSITAGVSLNLFGDICGSDSLDITSLLHLNLLGTHRSWNPSIQNVLNLNFGVVAPLTLPSKKIFELPWDRKLVLAGKILSSAIPIYSSNINLATSVIPMLPSIYNTAWEGLKLIRNPESSWDLSSLRKSIDQMQTSLGNKKLKDIVPMIIAGKNVVEAGMGLFSNGQGALQEYKDHFTWDKLQDSIKNINLTDFGWKGLTATAGFFGPNYSSSSVFDVNGGFIGAVNVSSMNYSAINYGAKIAGLSLFHRTNTLTNEGLYQSLFGPTTLMGTQLSGSGSIRSEHGLTLIFNQISAGTGAVYFGDDKVYVNAQKFMVDAGADIQFKKGRIDLSGPLEVKHKASFYGEELNFNSSEIDTQGRVLFKDSSVKTAGFIRSSQGGEFTSLNGFLSAQDLIAAAYGVIELKDDRNRPMISSPTVQPDSAAGKLAKSQFDVELSGQIIIEEKGRLITNGVVVSANGVVSDGLASLQATELNLRDRFIVGEKGDVQGQELRLQASGVDVRGRGELERSIIEAKEKLSITKEAGLSIKESHVRSGAIDSQGKADFERSILEVQGEIKASEGGEISGLNSLIAAGSLTAESHGTVRLIRDPLPEVQPSAEAVPKEVHELSPADVDISGRIVVNETGTLITRGVLVKADEIQFGGQIHSGHSQFDIKNKLLFDKNAELKAQDTLFTSRTTEYHGKIDYRGALVFKSDEITASRDSQILFDRSSSRPGFLQFVAERGDLAGRIDADYAQVKIKNISDASGLVMARGRYDRFKVSDGFALETDAHLNINRPILRQCGLDLTGFSVQFNTPYQTPHDIQLRSTLGDITLSKDLRARNIYSDSAGQTYTTSKIVASQDAAFKSKGAHYNLGGDINASVIYVEAAEIKNITQGSKIYSQLTPQLKQITGASGAMHGSEVYLNAVLGNIENHGGVLEGSRFLQGVATGSILNIANEKLIRAKHDYLKEYDPAVILGGDGLDDEHIGLVLQSDGKLINDASTIFSVGNAYIDAKGGVESAARHHTYIAGKEKKRTWYGSKKEKQWTETIVQKAAFASSNGRIQIATQNGGFYGVGTDFITKNGTDIFSRDKVELYSLKVVNTSTKKKEILWGLSKSKHKERHESVFTTDFIDDGTTRIHSYESDIVCRGVRVFGGGHFEARAKGNICFSADVLSHRISDKQRKLGFSSGLFDLGNKIARGDIKSLIARDPTWSSIQALAHSQGVVSTAQATWDAYQSLKNTYQSFSSGIWSGVLDYINNMNFGFGVSYGVSSSKSYYETLGPGGIARGSCLFEAGESVILQGVPVDIMGDMFVKAKDFKQLGQMLSSYHKSRSYSLGLSISPTGKITDVNARYDESKSSITHYQPQELRVGGKLHVEVDRWEMDAAKTSVGQLTGEVKEQLTLTSRQDVTKAQALSISASSSGQVGLSQQQHSAKLVDQTTSIHVRDGINHEADHTFKVKEVVSTGAAITTEGVNKFSAETAIFSDIKDHSQTNGFSIAGNVAQMAQTVVARDKPMSSTIRVGVDKIESKAELQTTMHGDQSTEIQINKQKGKLHTSSPDGHKISKEVKQSIHVAIPVINQAELKQGLQKVKDVLGIKEVPRLAATKSQDVIPANVEEQTIVDSSETLVPNTDSPITTESETNPIAQPIEDKEQQSYRSDHTPVKTASKADDDLPELIDESIDFRTEQRELTQQILTATDYVASYAAEAADSYFTSKKVPVAGKIMQFLVAPVTYAANLHQQQTEGNPNAMTDALADTAAEIGVEYALPWQVTAVGRIGQWSRDCMEEGMRDMHLMGLSEESIDTRWECYGMASACATVGDAIDFVAGHAANLFKSGQEPTRKNKVNPDYGSSETEALIKNSVFKASKKPISSEKVSEVQNKHSIYLQ